jgi:Cohesin domain
MRHIATALTTLVLALLLVPAARAVTVSIQPADTTVAPGDTVSLRVVVTDFPDLKAYQLIHGFDPAHLASLAVLPGDLLTGSGQAYAAYSVPCVATPADSTWLDAAMLDGSTAGPGVLGYLVFKATTTGTANITCQHVELRNSLNVATLPDCAGAVVRIVAATPTRRSSWGSVKAAYR